MLDLKKKPYNLSDEQIQWVEDTIASMTIEEKIGQLFVNMVTDRSPQALKEVVDTYHPGQSVTRMHRQRCCMSRTGFCRNPRRFRF